MLLQAAAAASTTACTVQSGIWDCGGTSCTLNATSTGFTVTPNVKFVWAAGKATFGAGDTVIIDYTFDGPMPKGIGSPQRHGTISPTCTIIAWNDTSTWTCTSCPAVPDGAPPLDVHIISHTHDDTGYLSTVDEYYESNVRSILTTVTEELQKNPARRFTYVEIAFFAKWWDEQNNSTKAAFRRLVAEGQLDFTVRLGRSPCVARVPQQSDIPLGDRRTVDGVCRMKARPAIRICSQTCRKACATSSENSARMPGPSHCTFASPTHFFIKT